MNRPETAAALKSQYNCCQAVLLAFADKLPLSKEELLAIGSGFGSGMGCLKATCGALCGATIAAGMLNQTGRPASLLSRRILAEFEASCGATICGDLKGISTGTPCAAVTTAANTPPWLLKRYSEAESRFAHCRKYIAIKQPGRSFARLFESKICAIIRVSETHPQKQRR